MSAAAKAALGFHISICFFRVCEQQVQQSIFTSWVIDDLHQEVIVNKFKKIPGVLVFAYTLPADASCFRPWSVCSHEVSLSFPMKAFATAPS